MHRRLLTLIASAVLALGAGFGLAACGDDDDEEIAPVEIEDTTTGDTTTGDTTEGTTTEETTTESEGGTYGY